MTGGKGFWQFFTMTGKKGLAAPRNDGGKGLAVFTMTGKKAWTLLAMTGGRALAAYHNGGAMQGGQNAE